MKKIAILSLVTLLSTTSVMFAGGKNGGKCCKASKECKDKEAAKTEESKAAKTPEATK